MNLISIVLNEVGKQAKQEAVKAAKKFKAHSNELLDEANKTANQVKAKAVKAAQKSLKDVASKLDENAIGTSVWNAVRAARTNIVSIADGLAPEDIQKAVKKTAKKVVRKTKQTKKNMKPSKPKAKKSVKKTKLYKKDR